MSTAELNRSNPGLASHSVNDSLANLSHSRSQPRSKNVIDVGIGTFAAAIRQRRRQLDLTQRELARYIGSSTAYVGHLESGKRHPSATVLTRLTNTLGLDPRELFLLANPNARALLKGSTAAHGGSAWEKFRKDRKLRRLHQISDREMNLLSYVALLGEVESSRDFVYILNTVRHALVRSRV